MQKRYVIYSAMVGAYDDILQPLVIDERFDYILFSNEIKEKNVGVWQVRPISYHNNDNTRICRYVKTHPEELLGDYDVSVWMDSNIQICVESFYQRIIEIDQQGYLICSTDHPTRNCIYEEAFAVMNMRVEYEAVVIDWCHHLRQENYPRTNGLCETGVIFRKHRDTQVAKVDAFWWECIDNYSRRDQLSFNYALWKNNMQITYIWGEKKHVGNVDCVLYKPHNDLTHNNCPLLKDEAWLMRHCWKHREDTERIEELYYKLYALHFPKLWVAIVGQYFRLIDRIKG